MRQVFSKKLLARDLDTAAHYSKEFQLDAITKDGDQVRPYLARLEMLSLALQALASRHTNPLVLTLSVHI